MRHSNSNSLKKELLAQLLLHNKIGYNFKEEDIYIENLK